MKNVIARFWALVVLVFLLIPGVKASGQTPNPQSPPDELSVKQARHALISASRYAAAYQFHHATFSFPYFVVNPSSIVLAPDSIEFDATSKKKETKHFSIGLKDLKKVTSSCNRNFCSLETPAGTIQDKQAVQYDLLFGWDPYGPDVPLCNIAKNAGECSQAAAWFASALNSLHAFANSHPADTRDFHQQAASWSALAAKPPLPEEVRLRRLLAEDAVKNKKPVEALNEYEIGLEFYPTWPEGHFNAALIAAELGDLANAVEHMQAYLELVPNAPDAQAARDQLAIWQHKAGQ
jgi:tetratricopeptide (TPR) repeat protein